jgi:hypothetical protein
VSTPVNRMSEYYADADLASTIDYIGYCWKRLYPNGGAVWHYKEQPIGGEFHCGFAAILNGQACLAKFRVPVDAGGAKIKNLCDDAAQKLNDMISRFATK